MRAGIFFGCPKHALPSYPLKRPPPTAAHPHLHSCPSCCCQRKLFELSAQAVRVVSNEVLLNREIKSSAEDPKGMRLRLFLSICQGKATGTWQCLWCPPPAPAAPLIYHRPGPLTKPTHALGLGHFRFGFWWGWGPPKTAMLMEPSSSFPQEQLCRFKLHGWTCLKTGF
jgi:hypothetical protein